MNEKTMKEKMFEQFPFFKDNKIFLNILPYVEKACYLRYYDDEFFIIEVYNTLFKHKNKCYFMYFNGGDIIEMKTFNNFHLAETIKEYIPNDITEFDTVKIISF